MNNASSSNKDNDNEINLDNFVNLCAVGAVAWFDYTIISMTSSTRRNTSVLSGVIKVDELLNGHLAIMFNKVCIDRETFIRLSTVL